MSVSTKIEVKSNLHSDIPLRVDVEIEIVIL